MGEMPAGGANSMNEIVFEVAQEADGGFTAEALGESIFTQADGWDELKANVKEAVQAFYFDSVAPASIRLHLTRDEVSRSHETPTRSERRSTGQASLQALGIPENPSGWQSHHPSNPAASASPHCSAGAHASQNRYSERDPIRCCRAQERSERFHSQGHLTGLLERRSLRAGSRF